MRSPTDGPSPAERARTALAVARAGCLLTYPRGRCVPPRMTRVGLQGGEEEPVFFLAPGSPAAAQLQARPFATMHTEWALCDRLIVQGPVAPLPAAGDGRLRFRLEVAAVRLGARARLPVDLEEFRRARPDPLYQDAPAVLRHLAECHRPALIACLRARGYAVAEVEPRALDCTGLEVAVLNPAGVTLVRLPFPRRVRRLQDLPAGLAGPLLCRCRKR